MNCVLNLTTENHSGNRHCKIHNTTFIFLFLSALLYNIVVQVLTSQRFVIGDSLFLFDQDTGLIIWFERTKQSTFLTPDILFFAVIMTLSQAQRDLLQQWKVTIERGLTTDEALARREEAGCYNTVDPPIKCPTWVCCLLPCIQHVPSMKAYQQIQAEDAEVKRDSRWIRYDASSLVQGDIIRMEEGDIVPADCVVLQLEEGCVELLVDHRLVTGEVKPVSAKRLDGGTTTQAVQLHWGGRIVLGSCVAVCTAIGPNTRVAKLIREGRFPVTVGNMSLSTTRNDEESGISLIGQNSRDVGVVT